MARGLRCKFSEFYASVSRRCFLHHAGLIVFISLATAHNQKNQNTGCKDKSKKCPTLAMKGYCLLNTSKMIRNCPESCSVCGEGDPCIHDQTDNGAFPGSSDLDARFNFIITDPSMQKYKPKALSKDPWVVVLENFLDDAEVKKVRAAVGNEWKRSTAGGLVGEDTPMEQRTSEQFWCQLDKCRLSPGQNLMLAKIEEITNVSRTRYEDTQYLRYLEGQRYQHHLDWISGQNPLACGPRMMTFFVYLSDSPGAGTDFPRLRVGAEARKGTAALWQNVHSNNYFEAEPRTMHQGLAPKKGNIKYAANVWIHQYDFKRYNDIYCLVVPRKLQYHKPLRAEVGGVAGSEL